MSLADLQKVLTRPKSPTDAKGDFAAIERALGVELPTDYKELVASYGSGRIRNFITMMTPFSSGWLRRISGPLAALHTTRAKFGSKEVPFSLFPEKDGVLPFATTDNGNGLFFVTKGPFSKWSILVTEGRGPDFDRHRGPVTKALAELITGKWACSVFPDEFAYDAPSSPIAYEALKPRNEKPILPKGAADARSMARIEAILAPKRGKAAKLDASAIESLLGGPLPEDYKAFMARYGGGEINGALRILDPFSPDPAQQIVREALARLGDVVTLSGGSIGEWIDGSPIAIPWGKARDGATFFWGKKGVLVVSNGTDGRAAVHEERGSAMALVAELLEGKRVSDHVPRLATPTFVPHAIAKEKRAR